MENIALPQKIEFIKGKSDNSGQIVVEPCFPGYGITIGNSVRRVLLSSLPGAAPVGVLIEGVSHEFMALPHLKEDVLEFILNLKKIRLKVFSDETIILNLNVHGKKTITAGDIEPNSEVLIANPELELGTITDMAGKLNAKIYVEQGMGYVSIESREEKQDIVNYIEMDSIFSPVLSTGLKIENVRVGKMTNWEKLIIDIKTDGTISPEDAFKESVAILIAQFKALAPEKVEKKEVKKEKKEDKDEKEEEVKETKEREETEKEDDADEAVEEKKKRGRPKKK